MDKEQNIPPHPGIELSDFIGRTLYTRAEIAKMLNTPRQYLHGIITGNKPISPKMAAKLGKMFGTGGYFWLVRQAAHDAALAEKTVDLSRIQPLEVDGAFTDLNLIKGELRILNLAPTEENLIQHAVRIQNDNTIKEGVSYFDNFYEFVIVTGKDNLFFNTAIKTLDLPMTIETMRKLSTACLREAVRRGLKIN